MTFKTSEMYRNILKDKDNAFLVDEVLEANSKGVHLSVTWYKKTTDGRYITIGVEGEFYIPKSQLSHYVGAL